MTHPLDQISPAEIEKAVDLYKSHEKFDEKTIFSNISLVEPEKQHLREHEATQKIPRILKIVGIDSEPDGGFLALVNLTEDKVDVERVSGQAQVQYTIAEIYMAIELTKANKEYQEALGKRGITDMDLVSIDPWPAGGIVHESIEKGHRSFKTISFIKEDKTDNKYAKPINGVISHVDLTLMEVTHVEDHGVVQIPKGKARYDAESQAELREQPNQIDITQPDGPGFEIEGNKINWEGWQVRVSIDPLEGLVVHQLSLDGREILHRAALSDMVVPYGSADPMHSWKAVHDGTEYGLGFFSNSLTLGCDCLGEIHYLDANFLFFDGGGRVRDYYKIHNTHIERII